jgi:hypothetical protein
MIAFKKAKPVHTTSLLFLPTPAAGVFSEGAMLFHKEIVPGEFITTL